MRLAALLLLFWCAGLGSVQAAAAAQSTAATLQHAMELSLDAEFDAARALFDQLLVSGTLTPEERVLALSERSLVLFAVGAEDELAEDLRQLAQLAPEARLSERAPPALLARWQQVSAGAREAKASSVEVAAPRTGLPAIEMTSQLAPPEAEEPANPRRKRALWIGGAAAIAAAALVTTLVLTLSSDRPAGRTAVKPSVEF